MHIEYLEEFTELAQCLNFTEAARRCNITQPALSKHLVALEKEMGAQLVVRDRRNVELSQAGHVLFQEALPFCEQYRALKERVRAMTSMPTLRIGGLLENSRVLWILSSALSPIDHGETLACTYSRDYSRSFLSMLDDEEIDLAFIYRGDGRSEDDARYGRIELFEDRFVVIVRDDHPLAAQETVSMSDLAKHRLIKLTGPYFSLGWERIAAICEAHGFTPQSRTTAMQPGMDYSLVDLRDDVFVLSQTALTGQLFARARSFVCMPVTDEDAHFSICALYRADNDNRALRILAERLASIACS